MPFWPIQICTKRPFSKKYQPKLCINMKSVCFAIHPSYYLPETSFPFYSLAIETGRHTGTERSMRNCVLCNMNVVESEFHFMLVCPFYSELRNKYLPRYYNHWPTLQKFEDLIAKQSKHSIQQISRYIHYAFQKRTNLLN